MPGNGDGIAAACWQETYGKKDHRIVAVISTDENDRTDFWRIVSGAE